MRYNQIKIEKFSSTFKKVDFSCYLNCIFCAQKAWYIFLVKTSVFHILSKFLYCHKLKNTAIYFYFVYNFSGASWGGLLSVYRLQWWKCVRCINIFCDWIANWTMERIIKLWKWHEIFCNVLFGIICRDNYSMSLVVCFYLYIVLKYYKVNLLWHQQVKDLLWL